MTAAILRDAVMRRLDEARQRHLLALRMCKYQPAAGTDKGIVPAVTVEQIALFANQTNASIEMLDGIADILNHEFRKLTEPEVKKSADITPINKKKRMY